MFKKNKKQIPPDVKCVFPLNEGGKRPALHIIGGIALLSWLAFQPFGASASAFNNPIYSNGGPNELIVLFDDGALSDSVSAEDIVGAVANPQKSAQYATLWNRLGNPKHAHHLIQERFSTVDSNSISSSKTADTKIDSPDTLLQKYVVLTYASASDRAQQEQSISRDTRIRWVGQNTKLRPSITPTDPFATQSFVGFNYGSPPPFYQYALANLNLFAAWETVRGHAYVGHLDIGIQSSPVHPDLAANFRPQFSYSTGGSALPNPAIVDDVWHYIDPVHQTNPTIRGHGTHTAGIIAASTTPSTATTNPPSTSATGVAGICWYCNLMVVLVREDDSTPCPWNSSVTCAQSSMTQATFASGIYSAVKAGAQILNFSFGDGGLPDKLPVCQSPTDLAPYCQALQFASTRSVLISAAAGNYAYEDVQSPAKDGRVLAVAAVDGSGGIWQEANDPSLGSSHGASIALSAPGVDVLSTFREGASWADTARCGDYWPSTYLDGHYGEYGYYLYFPPESPWAYPGWGHYGYGDCTGTSMAAPQVAGIAGLLRSLNPLLTAGDIGSALRLSGNRASYPDYSYGWGTPNAANAVSRVLATTNRLTPLFSLYSDTATDYFYTTAPQMAAAAVSGTLGAVWPGLTYAPVGSLIFTSDYIAPPGPQIPPPSEHQYIFPGINTAALAQAWIFSSHKNPFSTTVDLVPLYRLSYACNTNYGPLHAECYLSGSYHSDHTYSTDWNEVNTLKATRNYKFDGIEGYVFPVTQAPKPGMVQLIRAYHATRDDYAIFPAGEQASMTAQGYSQNLTTLGYVYPNLTSRRPVY